MSKHFARRPDMGGICRTCRHDLAIRPNGTAHCTNDRCKNHTVDYKLGPNVNS